MSSLENDALIATHNLNRAAFYQALLIELGYVAHIARDGDEAQQLIARNGVPRLLIADVSLPKIDGISIVRRLRREHSTDRLAAIVVSAHQPLRTMASLLTESLGITRVLPIDADRAMLREAIQAAVPLPAAVASLRQEPALSSPVLAPDSEIDDALQHAAVDGIRHFHVWLCMAYVKATGREHLVAHMATADPPGDVIDLPGAAFMRQIAMSDEPLILPDLKAVPVAHEFSLGHVGCVRGFAGVPIAFEHDGTTGAVCLLDRQPLVLDAAELDKLAAFARDMGRQVERRSESGSADGTSRRTSDALKTLEQLAVTDPLTGLSNRRGGEQNIASEISRARRQRSTLSCILLDIDRFKAVNDTRGHQAGDRLLRDVSSLLRRTVRAYDVLIRWGGDEFLIVLPGVGLSQAHELAERIRNAVEALETDGVTPMTVSAGAATLDADYDFEAMLAQADRRLYQAKAAGRNCVA